MTQASEQAAQRIEHLRLLGRYIEAEQVARQALAADPSDGLLLFGLAAVLHQQGRYAEALRAADAAVVDLPEPPVHRQRALALSALGRHPDAREASATAVSLDPHAAASLIVHAAVLQQARALPAATDAARQAVELAPEEPTAHLVMAGISADLGDRVSARAAYLEVLRLDPDNAAARHDLALLDLAQGRAGPALRGLLEAGALDPAALGTGGGLPVLTNVTAVLWRLTWYLRLVLFLSLYVVGTATLAGQPEPRFEPSIPARIAAAAVLVVAGLVSWRFVRGLPPQARPVLVAATRSDRLLIVSAALIAAGFGVYGLIVVTGYGLLFIVVFGLVTALFVITVAAAARNRWRRRG